jgi:hypothetical protein
MGSCTSRVEVEPEKGIKPYVVKILLFGPCNTGKTKFRTSIANLSEKIEPTDGIDFSQVYVSYKKFLVKLYIWDSSGNAKYEMFVKDYVEKCDIIVLFYKQGGEEELIDMYERIKPKISKDSVVVIVRDDPEGTLKYHKCQYPSLKVSFTVSMDLLNKDQLCKAMKTVFNSHKYIYYKAQYSLMSSTADWPPQIVL